MNGNTCVEIKILRPCLKGRTKKPYPGGRIYNANGQARRPGVWCTDDESTWGEGNFVAVASPEDAILEKIDEQHAESIWLICVAINDAKVARRVAKDASARRIDNVIRAWCADGPAAPMAPTVVRIGDTKGYTFEPKTKVETPKPVLKTGLRLNGFAALASAIAA